MAALGVASPDIIFASAGLEELYGPIRLASNFDFWFALSSGAAPDAEATAVPPPKKEHQNKQSQKSYLYNYPIVFLVVF